MIVLSQVLRQVQAREIPALDHATSNSFTGRLTAPQAQQQLLKHVYLPLPHLSQSAEYTIAGESLQLSYQASSFACSLETDGSSYSDYASCVERSARDNTGGLTGSFFIEDKEENKMDDGMRPWPCRGEGHGKAQAQYAMHGANQRI